MANQKISELTALLGSNVADDDALAIVDTSTTQTKKITKAELATAIGNGDFTFTGASYNVVWDNSDNALEFADNAKAIFGAGSDLQIYHDGSNSYIKEGGTGQLVIRSEDLRLQDANGTNWLQADTDGAVRLYHNNSNKLATTSTGIDITGVITTDGMTTSADINFSDNDKAIFGAGSDLQIYHNATHSYIDNNTGNIYIRSNVDDDDGGNIVLEAKAGESGIIIADDGDVSLHYNGILKLATTNTGVAITGTATMSGGVYLGGTASANLLDDYDEGSWDVEMYDASSGGNASSTQVTGRYTKIGQQVIASFDAFNNVSTSGLTSGNAVYFTLPFAASTTGRACGSCHLDAVTFPTGTTMITPIVNDNNSRAQLYASGSATGDTSVKVSSFNGTSSDVVNWTLSYRTAS